jgi:diguanylate cyclase (GGDEF)-like protein
MIDLDHFKRINDTHGHDMGDRIIQRLAHLLHAQETQSIIPCRMGGEEFLLLFLNPPTADIRDTLADAHAATDSLRTAFADVLSAAGLPGATLSAGLGSGTVKHIETVLRQADIALYGAKSAGRDRVMIEQL